MDGKIPADVLQQRWVHSREEDTDTEMVFRPSTYQFPPARGRESFELGPDGRLVAGGIGATDRRELTPGTWKLQDDEVLAFYTGSGSEPSRTMRVVYADKDQLRVKK